MRMRLTCIVLITMLFIFTGCADEKNTDSTETTTATAASDETVEPSPSEILQEILDNRSDGLWAITLTDKINNWKSGNVLISMSYEKDGIGTTVGVNILGNRYYFYRDIITITPDTQMNISYVDIIYDGTKSYSLNEKKLIYCVDTSGQYNKFSYIAPYLLSAGAANYYIGSGIEELDGTPYIYEEYLANGYNSLKYYFDGNGNIHKIGQMVDGQMEYFNFNVDFSYESVSSIYTIPRDYEEVSYEEFVRRNQ